MRDGICDSLRMSTPGGRSANFCRSTDFGVSVEPVDSPALGALGVSTTLAGSTLLEVSCTAFESLPASDRLLDPAWAPADTKTIAATKTILRI